MFQAPEEFGARKAWFGPRKGSGPECGGLGPGRVRGPNVMVRAPGGFGLRTPVQNPNQPSTKIKSRQVKQ